jgi:HSP20 family protein
MSIVRWEPFAGSPAGEFDNLINRLMPAMFGRWPSRPAGSDGGNFKWAPSADISETDKEYLIRAELPAVKKEDVKVTVDDGMITIEGERKQQQEDKSEKMHRVESFYGRFTRSFSLPESVDQNAIRCESKEGVLTVHIPKAQTQKQQPKQIKVD